MNRWERVWAYLQQRLREPSSWAAILAVAGSFWPRLNMTPEQQSGIIALALLVFGAREAQNSPANPTLPTVVKGQMPEAKPPIVPAPPAESTVAIDPKHVDVDAEGNLKAPEQP